jgi:type II secretory pathway pseudopilin PulG
MARRIMRSAGFSVLELAIVVAIIAIMVSLALPSFRGAMSLIEHAECYLNQRHIRDAALVYYTDRPFVTPEDGFGDGEVFIDLTGTVVGDPGRDLGRLIDRPETFDCPSDGLAADGDTTADYLTDGYVVTCLTDGVTGLKSDGAAFVHDTSVDVLWRHVALSGAVVSEPPIPPEPPPPPRPGPQVLTVDDGVYISTSYGRLMGPYSGPAGDIMIPNVLNGFDVKYIWQDVFNGTGLTSVEFEENSRVERIHARAFRNNNLIEIDFPDGLKRIDLYAFSDNSLREIVLPSSLERIEMRAFSNNDITRITIGSGVTIDDNAFGNNDFRNAYYAGGQGTYVLVDGNWEKSSGP